MASYITEKRKVMKKFRHSVRLLYDKLGCNVFTSKDGTFCEILNLCMAVSYKHGRLYYDWEESCEKLDI